MLGDWLGQVRLAMIMQTVIRQTDGMQIDYYLNHRSRIVCRRIDIWYHFCVLKRTIQGIPLAELFIYMYLTCQYRISGLQLHYCKTPFHQTCQAQLISDGSGSNFFDLGRVWSFCQTFNTSKKTMLFVLNLYSPQLRIPYKALIFHTLIRIEIENTLRWFTRNQI